MVQVLPAFPAFGSQLAEVIAQAGGNIAQGLMQRSQNLKDQQILQSLPEATSPLEVIQRVGALSPERQKMLTPLFDQYLKGVQAQNIAQTKASQKSGGMASLPPEEKELLQGVVGRMAEIQKKGNIGLVESVKRPFSSEAREDVAEFNTLRASIEAALLPLVNKGTLAQKRFDYILSNIPVASDTKATQRGKIKALTREFGLIYPFGEKYESSKVEKKEKPKLELGDIFK